MRNTTNKTMLSVLMFTLALSAFAFAHPPKNIELSFKGNTAIILVTHPVKDPKSHFIDLITLKLNGSELVKQTFSLQQGNEQEAMYIIPEIKKGDAVEIYARCSVFGDLTKRFKY